MKRIYKYPLERMLSQELWLPQHAQILCVKAQKVVDMPGFREERLMLWAVVNPDDSAQKERIIIIIYPTGEDVDLYGCTYIDTVLVHDGTLVWHVFRKVLS